MINDHECRAFTDLFIRFLFRLLTWVLFGTFLAMPEVVLVIPDFVLDNFLRFGKKFAKHIFHNEFFEFARLTKSLNNVFGFGKMSKFV